MTHPGSSSSTRMETQRFAVCAFRRVFDTEPKQEAVTLDELERILTRFEVKPDVRERMEKDVRRVGRSLKRVLSGQGGAGPAGARIRAAMRDAEQAGDDPLAAARQCAAHLEVEAAKAVKRDLRLWSPALYRPNSRRGSENVVHLSCLVLDYDGGTPIDEASATWAPWRHVLHTTWSHREEHPKFRVILPLSGPVAAEHWAAVWEWASARTHDRIDAAGKGAGATFALPVVADDAWPRDARSHAGPLLDPVAEGLVARAATAPGALPPVDEPMVIGAPKHRYIDHLALGAPRASAPGGRDNVQDWDNPGAWDPFSVGADAAENPAASGPAGPEETAGREETAGSDENAGRTAHSEPSQTDAGTGHVRTALETLRDELDAVVQRVRSLESSAVVDALERLVALHEQGLLDDEEFGLAKRAVLRDE